MGDASGPLGASVTYDVAGGRLRVEDRSGTHVTEESIFDYLTRELGRLRRAGSELPFDFDCGFAGYLGYELKAECGGAEVHRSTPCRTPSSSSPTGWSPWITSRGRPTCSRSPSRAG